MKIVGLTDYTNQTQFKHFEQKRSKFNTPKNERKYCRNVHKKVGAHLQSVNNHYAKLKYKEMKTLEVTDYTN